MQYRAVNFAEQSLVAGALELDRARTNLAMLANPRRDPNNPNQLLPGVISPETVAEIEREAVGLTQQFRSLNRAHVLDTFKELVTQFSSPGSAFQLLPMMLQMQEWQVLQGQTVEQAREGNSRLVRAMGLSGRLVDNNGQLLINRETGRPEAQEFIENYLRARMIGGVDVTPDQVFQVMKYLKTTGQTMNQDALLTAFIGMPDIRGSTFGNSLDQLRLQLTGRATKEAQAAQAAAGLITGGMQQSTPGGPNKFVRTGTIDEEMLGSNPFEWFNRHILGPQGYLRSQGLDPLNSTAAQIAPALSRILSRATAANIANMIVNQQAEWRTQVENARRFNLTPEALASLGSQSTWYQLQSARSKLQDVMGSIIDNFKLLLPILESITKQMGKIAAFMDPQIGTPLAGMGLLGAGAIAGFLTFRRAIAAMGTWSRTLLGGGLGFMVGGPAGAITGGMLLRSMGGGVAAGLAAGAAGAAAGASFARRFVSAAGTFLRSIPKLLLWGAVIEGVLSIIDHWESVKTRLLGIWEELKQAAPTWLGGQGKGWGAIGMSDQGVSALGGDLRNYAQSWYDTIYGPLNNRMFAAPESLQKFFNNYVTGGPQNWPDEPAPMSSGPGAERTSSVTIGAVTNNITVNVGGSNADANAIGEAAGNAVQSQLRGLMTDMPAAPYRRTTHAPSQHHHHRRHHREGGCHRRSLPRNPRRDLLVIKNPSSADRAALLRLRRRR